MPSSDSAMSSSKPDAELVAVLGDEHERRAVDAGGRVGSTGSGGRCRDGRPGGPGRGDRRGPRPRRPAAVLDERDSHGLHPQDVAPDCRAQPIDVCLGASGSAAIAPRSRPSCRPCRRPSRMRPVPRRTRRGTTCAGRPARAASRPCRSRSTAAPGSGRARGARSSRRRKRPRKPAPGPSARPSRR